MRKPYITFVCAALLFFIQMAVFAQSNNVNPFDCPIIDKRNNGNGQYNQGAGIFPGYGLNNPVAVNVVGTSYQTVPYAPSSKTGNINFKWITNPVAAPVNLPIISRVWITASGVTTLMSVKFGPPPPASLSGGAYYVNYHFYMQNIPPQGTLTLEFTDPISRLPVKLCSYDLQTNNAASTPPTINCIPTITTQPVNQSLCGNASSASFNVVADGVATYQWQVSSNGGSSWTNISNGVDYTGATSTTLSIANPTSYDGTQYQVILTGNAGCSTKTSSPAILVAKPKPTAQFATTSYCGTGSRSIRVDLTGTAPWSFTYTAGGITPGTTISGINSTPYYFSVNPGSATTYAITGVSDAYCSNTSPSGSINTTVGITPSVTLSSSALNICYGTTSVQLSYSGTTGAPTTYSINTGTRAMTGFTSVTNASMPASSPFTITIPANTPAGTYDFNLVVSNGTCSSATIPFTITVNALPGVTATASSSTVCSGSSITLTAAGASTYSWTSSPNGFTSTSSTPSVSPTVNTTYTVTGTSNGCTNTASISVSVLAVPVVSIAASSNSVCSSGQQVTLTASGANTYSWSGGTPSVSGSTGTFIVVTPTSSGTYSVTGTASNGCTSSASQAITVSAGLTLTSNLTICQGSSTSLTVSGATTYLWTPAATLSSSTASTVTATPTQTTTYTVYGTISGCTSYKQVTVTVYNPLTTAPPSELMYCASDLSGGTNNQLSFGFTSPSAVTCGWEYNTTNSWPGTAITSTNNNQQYSRSEIATTSVTSSTVYVRTPGNGGQFIRLSVTSGGCTSTYVTKLISLTATPSITISSNQTICSGTSPSSLSASGYVTAGTSSPATSFTYKWQSSTDGTTFSDISSTNSTTYSPSTLTQDTWYRWAIVLTGNCAGTYYSASVKMTIASTVSSNTVSVTDACAAGAAITGSTPTGGNGTFSYIWESSTTSSSSGFTAIGGATSQSYSPSSPSQTTWYRRSVSSGNCSNVTSSSIVIYPSITNTTISTGQTICSSVGSLNNLTVSPSGGPSPSYSYVWESSNDNISYSSASNTSSTLSPAFAEGTKYYRVKVTSGTCTSTSNVAKVVVNPNPTVSMSASATNVCAGSSVTLTASGAVSYSWSPNPSASLSSYTGAIVTATPSASTTYSVVGTNTYGCTGSSSGVAITYNAAPSQPTVSNSNVTTCGSSVDLSSYASGTALRWYSVPNPSESYRIDPVSSISTAGTYYVYDYNGTCASANYGTVAVSFSNVSVSVDDDVVTICNGTYDLTQLQPAARTGVTYEWYSVDSYSNPAYKLSTPNSVNASGNYYLFAKSTAGNCYGTSSSTLLTIVGAIATPTLNTSAASSCAPASFDLDSYYSGSGGLSYNWYTSSTPTGADAVLNKDAVSTSGTYYLFATDANGCRSSSSTGLTITINPIPTASISSPDPYCGDVSRTITVTTDASSPTYMWEESTDGGQNWTPIYDSYKSYSGSTTNALYISTTTNPILSGYYFRAIVTKSGCSTTSDAAILVGQSTATIATNPTATAIHSNSNGTFTVDYDGIVETIQWQYSTSATGSFANLSEATPYSGVTNSTMLITNPTNDISGYYYRAQLYNTCGYSYSDPAMLTVLGPLPVTWNGFNVKAVAEKVVLNWGTSSEQNSDQFIVQQSNDAAHWRDLGAVKAAGNSMKPLYYSFVDNNPERGDNFYRILQKDFDGRITKSSVQHIQMSNGEIVFKILQQPIQNGMIQAKLSRPMQAALLNQQGQLLQKINLQSGYNEIRVASYAKGIYYIKAENNVYKVMIANN